MRIGELAAAGGVRAATLRYYERRGLLPRPLRTAAGYRTYNDAALGQLRLIRWAKGLGFTLREIRELARVSAEHAEGRGAAVRDRARRKLQEVDARLGQLQAMRAQLEALVACRCKGECPVLSGVRAAGRGPRGRS
jgi:MerR family copper efflux transcriptional regulator